MMNTESFVKNIEITDGKTDTIYSALSNEIERCGGVGFGSDGVSLIIGHKKNCLKIKKG